MALHPLRGKPGDRRVARVVRDATFVRVAFVREALVEYVGIYASAAHRRARTFKHSSNTTPKMAVSDTGAKSVFRSIHLTHLTIGIRTTASI